MNRHCSIATGLVLAVIGCVGLWISINISVAQNIYFEAKYGTTASDQDAILLACSMAHSFYPHNYYCALLAAETAWNRRNKTRTASERSVFAAEAEKWCDIGLKLNPYERSLRYLKMRILEERSIGDAIRYWERHVEWQFWSPFNHLVLVELYANAGEFEKALESLKWVRGTEYERDAVLLLRRAWEQERDSFPSDACMPPPLFQR